MISDWIISWNVHLFNQSQQGLKILQQKFTLETIILIPSLIGSINDKIVRLTNQQVVHMVLTIMHIIISVPLTGCYCTMSWFPVKISLKEKNWHLLFFFQAYLLFVPFQARAKCSVLFCPFLIPSIHQVAWVLFCNLFVFWVDWTFSE